MTNQPSPINNQQHDSSIVPLGGGGRGVCGFGEAFRSDFHAIIQADAMVYDHCYYKACVKKGINIGTDCDCKDVTYETDDGKTRVIVQRTVSFSAI